MFITKTEIIGIDGGNNEVKIFGPYGPLRFPSSFGEWRERKLKQNHGQFDMEYEFRGKKGFAGTLAEYESEYNASLPGDTKAHNDHLIRVLLALHQYSKAVKFKIVTGQPIIRHDEKEKQRIKEMLEGKHEITINGLRKNIEIVEAIIAAEGGSAFWSNPKPGLVRILDFGSGTVNAATLVDGRYVDKESFTIVSGMDTNITKDNQAMARLVAGKALKKWKRNDQVYTVGGAAEVMLDSLKEHFYHVEILKPKVDSDEYARWNHKPEEKDIVRVGDQVRLHPIFSNAVGNYRIAELSYSEESNF